MNVRPGIQHTVDSLARDRQARRPNKVVFRTPIKIRPLMFITHHSPETNIVEKKMFQEIRLSCLHYVYRFMGRPGFQDKKTIKKVACHVCTDRPLTLKELAIYE